VYHVQITHLISFSEPTGGYIVAFMTLPTSKKQGLELPRPLLLVLQK